MRFIAGMIGSVLRLWVTIIVLLVIIAMLLACTPQEGNESGAAAATSATGGEPIADPGDSPAAPAGRSALPLASRISGEIPGITEIVIEQATAPDATVPEVVPVTVSAPEPLPPTVAPSPVRPPPAAAPASQPAPTPAPPTPIAVSAAEAEVATETLDSKAEPPTCTGYRIEDLLFDSASATLTSGATGSLEAMAALIPPGAMVIVVGHTDSLPIAIGNQALSEMRADAVADALIVNGVSEAQLDRVEGRGDSEPIASNDTPEGRRMNRRVEVYVNCSEVPRN